MHTITRLGVVVATALATTAVFAPSVSATESRADQDRPGARHAVFVQTDNLAGNQIVAYHREDDGHLSMADTYDTGGLGGMLAGSAVDHLASQGSLTYDEQHALLYAVNAGSNTVTVFSVDGDRLTQRQIISSGGTFPVSVAVHDDVVYVLNALDGGSIQGYRVADGRLHLKRDWNRCLGLDPSATPQFTNTPGQVGFIADGSQLLVTTKANGNALDVFALDHGAPADTPVVNVQPGTVPFGFVQHGPHLLVAQAGPNAVSTQMVAPDGTATQSSVVDTGQAATCWISRAGRFAYASNAGSATLSGYRIGDGGVLSALGTTPTDPGTVDSAVTPDGRYLYVQTGANGIVDEFRVNDDGSLTEVGSVTVPGAVGGEGIVAA
ncbi:6-phosphogluconolactonase (cycloisomerase 2 family) [Kitasatospora sp. MAP12-15]|uniref:lactonase family protein n=1 Tax=unclassified Kitasatospora TaxID=2633591 RepID=UPI0024760897|nr:beta-propeller fold lactonase family protein [Kitasatospora sp. MAP12-44]MDH6115006.1 6-phosphogluconolactonase (cycloisomerase 2 family) [Kitasatospora sp. MAP12-44]